MRQETDRWRSENTDQDVIGAWLLCLIVVVSLVGYSMVKVFL